MRRLLLRAARSLHPTVWMLIAASAALAACGDDDGPGPDAALADAALADAAPPDDAASPVDAGTDAAPVDAGSDAGIPTPLFRNPLPGIDDATLASQALAVLGRGTEESCAGCHAITRQRIRYWRAMSDTAWSTCLTDLEVATESAARDVEQCLRGEGAAYDVHRLGVFSAAARLEWFPFVLRRALGATAGEAAYQRFVDEAGMPPRSRTPFDQDDFDVVAEWFLRGVPGLDAALPEDPPPTECTPGVSSDAVAYIRSMATTGWQALNLESGLLMHGCAGAASPRDCLASAPRVLDLPSGDAWEHPAGTTMRHLATTPYATSYWTRSSADGRFVGHGGGPSGASIVDLQTSRFVGVQALYDPGFFPDNSGFVFQGSQAGFCEQSVLTVGTPSVISFTEPQCRRTGGIGLYEHVGASLGGGDYWVVHGSWVGDPGTQGRDPQAAFSGAVNFTRMRNDGSGFTPANTLRGNTPLEGDHVISPSSGLVVSRLQGPGGRQLGYVLRRVLARRGDEGTWSLALPEVARYCVNGGKPAISYDERWLVTHHYTDDSDAVDLGFTGPEDPDFAEYRTRPSANLYLVDLLTGERRRISNMKPGQLALFPHFRSDGWIYFMVRIAGQTEEYVVASDAALVLAP